MAQQSWTGTAVDMAFATQGNWVGAGTAATGTLAFSGQPSDADYVTIADGQHVATTFEFDSGGAVTAGRILCTIGANKEATMATLVALINAVPNLDVTATAAAPADHTCTLANTQAGTGGNVAIVKSCANLTATGMSAGTGGAVPVSTDSALFPAMAYVANKSVAGSDQSAILLVNFIVETGNGLTFGTRPTPLHIDADYVQFYGTGVSFFQVDNSTEIDIYNGSAGGTSSSTYGVYLAGNGTNALLVVDCGARNTVGVATFGTDTMTITTVDIRSGVVDLGDGLTVTTLNVAGATVTSAAAPTTTNIRSGTVTQASGTPGTMNVYGGTLIYNSPAWPTAINVYGGATLDTSKDARAKTGTKIVNNYGGTVI